LSRVLEEFVIARLVETRGDRLWERFDAFSDEGDARASYDQAVTNYGQEQMRLERHTIDVLDGPVQ
jgi:hypothetical protein